MNQRIKFIDTAKVITAFLVVFTHLYTFDDTFRLWVYSFHMPLFFLISGMFHKQYGSIWTMIRLNAKRLLIPAVFFIFCGALVFVAINGGGSAVGCMIETARGLVIGGKIPANNVIWFLFALFWDNVLLCLALKKKYIWAIIAVCYVFLVPATYKMFHLSQALFSLPFYIIGYVLIQHQMIKDEFELKGSKVIAAIGGAFCCS